MFTFMIGLEIHVQLKTKSKMFCRCSNEGEFQPPNTTICPICTGHPGTLPVVNAQAIEWGAKMALALNCTVNEWSKFDRKNYFYPDLPKGYQISQYDKPISSRGFLEISNPQGARATAHIRINRLHLEEDAAKLIHTANGDSLVDFNRASTPLMEIVTEPDITSPQEAKIFLQELRLIARHLDVSSADMEKGHLRCDANVSIHFDHEGAHVSSPISEIKNLNSFKAVEKALEYEGNRLYREWLDGGDVRKRTYKITVGWNDATETTFVQRSKEEAHDYRYFPEPDLPPSHFTSTRIEEIRSSIPELPAAMRTRLATQYGLPEDDARICVDDKLIAKYFEQTASELDAWLCTLSSCDDAFKIKSYRLLANWLINRLPPLLTAHNHSLETTKVTPENFAELIAFIIENKINSTSAHVVLEEMVVSGADPAHIIEERGLLQVSDTGAIESACRKVIDENVDAVSKYKAGKTTTIMFLVGQVMRDMKGAAQPDLVKEMLEKLLS
jgi:aspartyl-tRNA(Asn)/glutamyl-tRNA(Gln) amidotransferase subunit B